MKAAVGLQYTNMEKQIRDLTTLEQVFHGLFGHFRVKLHEKTNPGYRYGSVLDKDGTPIGFATDAPYRGDGFAVHTHAFAGYVPMNQIELC